jgi:hypothetical protein
MTTTARPGSPTTRRLSTRHVVPNTELPDRIGWQRAHSGTSDVWSTITAARLDGDRVVVSLAEFPAGPELRLDTRAVRDRWNTSIIRRPLTCRRCARPLSRRNVTAADRADITFSHVVDGVLVVPCDDRGGAPLPDGPAAGSSVTTRGGLDYVRVARHDGYDGVDEDDMVVMHDGLVVAGTFRTRPNRAAEDWASWGPAGDSHGHPTREAAEDVQIVAHRAGLADEQATFFDDGRGRLSTIARYGCRVVVIQAGTLLSDHTFGTVEEAAAGYANWKCDRRTDEPRRGDVIEILGVMDTDTVIRVSTVTVSTVTVHGTAHTRYKIRGTRVGGDGRTGVSVTRTVTRPAFYYVSRGVPATVSTAVPPAVPAGVSPAVSTAVPPAEPVSVPTPNGHTPVPTAVPIGVAGVSTPDTDPGVPTPGTSPRAVSTCVIKPVPRAPRTAPIMWTDVVPDRRPAPRLVGSSPAPVLPSTGHLGVMYAVQVFDRAAGWTTVESGERRLRHVTFDAVQAVADVLLAQAWRGDNRVRATVAGTTASGRPVVATLDGFETGSRTWPRARRRPATAFIAGTPGEIHGT